MKPFRKHRVLSALIALFGMLFMQLAVASYACPGLSSGSAEPSMSGPAEGGEAMPDCDRSDSHKPALCHAHCQDGQSSVDKNEVRTATPPAVLFVATVVSVEPAGSRPTSIDLPSLHRRSTAPPISIRHCCLRI